MRGIGGIFFDDLSAVDENGQQDQEACFAFARDCGEAFGEAYEPILKKRLSMPFTERQKRWQAIRRVRLT